MTDASRWKRAREVFDTVVGLEPSARTERISEACGDDVDLRREVESLLEFDRTSHDTIARIVADAALDASGRAASVDDVMPPAIGRYRVLSKIGEGGMGRVFLAEDTSLGRRVALKVPPPYLSDDPSMRARLQHEARAAATLNHPHVCVVHEVGEGPRGRPFIAMEYVEGETLAARIARGRLSLRDVLDIGRQAAGALHEAHSKGVVHRDLKPSNIMMTAHGIKLLDFGLASVARDSAFAQQGDVGRLMGTVPYMSPEQVRSDPLDQRTDLFSLGAVLYEAATGQVPFEAATARATCDAILNQPHRPPSELVSELPAAFDGMIARALEKHRDERYQRATDLTRDLERCALGLEAERDAAGAGVARFARRQALWLAPVVVVATIAAAVGYSRLVTPPARPTTASDTILLADIANTTGDPTFDGTLDEALAVLLEQTPYLHILPEASVRETLRQMTREPGERLTNAIAQEIASRRSISAWITGSISPGGDQPGVAGGDKPRSVSGYVVTLTALNGQSGAVIASERVEAADKLQVLGALGAAATRIRSALGESLQSIERFDAPIETAATASLDALKAYTLGLQQVSGGNYMVALSLFEQAVQIDPEFAIAYQAIARQRNNLVYSRALINEAATRAFDLRNRATEQERLAIEASYHANATGDLEQAVQINTQWATTYPNDWRPRHSLGDLYFTLGQYENAVASERETIRLNPDMASAYSNLAGALFGLDRFEEARTVYRQAMDRGLDAPEYHAFLWRIAYYLGDDEQKKRELDWAAASSSWSANMPSLAAALQGRWREALALSATAREGFERRQMTGAVALSRRYEALTGALVGDCQLERLQAAMRLNAEHRIEEWSRVAVALGLCGRGGDVMQLARRQATERPEDTLLTNVWLPLVRAAAAFDRSPEGVIDALQHTPQRYEGAAESLPIYVRGLAWLRLGKGVEARAEFQKIVDRKGPTFWFPFHPLAHLGVARASALIGDTAAAARAYEDFFKVWKNADADLPVLVAARKEFDGLRQ